LTIPIPFVCQCLDTITSTVYDFAQGCKTLQSLLQSSSKPLSPVNDIVIVSSDFKRTSETAQIVQNHFKIASDIIFEPALRERDFGQLNSTSDANYQKVWDVDSRDPQHTECGCESVASVVLRTSRLLQRLDRECKDKAILLVSHGDTLQILSTLFLGIPPNHHKTLPNLLPATVRELKQDFI
jgi:broad specificity phosphatase PhoE